LLVSWFATSAALATDVPAGTNEYGYFLFDYAGGCSDLEFDAASVITDFTNNFPISSIAYNGGLVGDGGPANTMWSGAAGSDWFNPANWDNGVPGCGSDIMIPGGTPVCQISSSKASLIVGSITLGGALSVLAGGLSISGDLTIVPGGSLVDMGGISVAGTTDYQMMANPTGKYTYFTPPVTPQDASPFLGEYLRSWDETSAAWVNVVNPGDPLMSGMGYSLFPVSGGPYSLNQGTLNTGDYTLAGLTSSGGPFDGFNLIGNQFPSGITFNASGLSNMDAFGWVWDGNAGNYLVTGNTLPADFIPAAQAFFVRALAGGGSVTILNSDRSHGGPMYKSADDNSLVITVAGEEYSDAIAVKFNDNASEDYDLGLDALKLIGLEEAPQMYTLVEGNVKLTGNTMPMVSTVPFNLEVGVDGTYTLVVDGIDSFEPGTVIELEDLATGNVVNLNDVNTYAFQASVYDDAERFMLKFGTVGIDDNLAENVKVYSFNSAIHVNMPLDVEGQVFVFNTMGQEIVSGENVNGNNTIAVEGGVNYIVKVVTANGVKTEKVFVK
jgi:flagellar motor switch/type III secretory pathway protein FliN